MKFTLAGYREVARREMMAEIDGSSSCQDLEILACGGDFMKRQIIRVEPLSTYLERWGAPTSAVTRYGDTIYVTGAPPYEPETGEIFGGDIRRQTRLVLTQMKACVDTAGSSLDKVVKCNVYCTSADFFRAINEVYVEFFPTDWPARMFVVVGPWAGRFDVEIDCIAGI